jgi:hypothetical protein
VIAAPFVEFIKSEVTLPGNSFGEPKLEQTIFSAFYQSPSKKLFKSVSSRPENWYKNSQILKFGADIFYLKANIAAITFLTSIREVVSQGRLPTSPEEQERCEMELALLYFQLSASSIEMLLKGIIIAKDPKHIKAEGKLSKKIKTHDLTKLLDLAEFSMPFEESNCPWSEDLPKKLTRFILWQGRYPVPIDISNKTFEGQFDLPWCAPSDKEDIDRFYSWLWQQRPSKLR